MKKTAQFGLNQWELSDRIQMEDFNADNAKIAEELSRLREIVANISYTVLQLGVGGTLQNEFNASQHALLCQPYDHPEYFTCTGGATMEGGVVKLSGAGAVGTVSSNRVFYVPNSLTEVRLWLHRRNGSVIPTINGVTLEKVRDFDDRTPLENAPCRCDEFVGQVRTNGSFNVSMELRCGSSSSMTLYDYTLVTL